MYTITINSKDYQCKLSIKSYLELERKLGTNPLNIFMKASEGEIPKLNDLILIFHGCLTEMNHGISIDDTYQLYSDYCAEGGSLLSLISIIADIFKENGYIPKETDSTKN